MPSRLFNATSGRRPSGASHALGERDAPLLTAFAEWMLSYPGDTDDDPRPYAPSTVRLRLAGIGRWLRWLDDYGWLPHEFPLAKAQRMVRDEMRAHRESRTWRAQSLPAESTNC